MFNISFIRF